MKQKPTVVVRNPLVRLVLFKRAGSHRKPHKALRKAHNQSVDNNL